jgi:hypothetical protein
MKNNFLIGTIIVAVIIGGYLIYQNFSTTPTEINVQPEEQTELQADESEDDKIYSVQELRDSNLLKGQYVKVKGIVGLCISLKVGADYEGPGSGCSLLDPETKISIHIGDFKFLEYKDQEIVIGGFIRYCGGNKKAEYICGLKDVEVIEVIQ